MSLKAYDGMVYKKGFHSLHEKIKENLHIFEAQSKAQVFKTYARILTKYIDFNESLSGFFKFTLINSDSDIKKLLEINTSDETTILSYLYQAANLASKSYFVNDFTVHLNLTIEPKSNSKILVYPNILVDSHRETLLTFLDDWYAQDNSDPDENVSKYQWKTRRKDWYEFNSTREMTNMIQLFNPSDFMGGIVSQMRGDELVNGILSNIISDKEREVKIQKELFLNDYLDNIYVGEENESPYRKIFKSGDYFNSDEGKIAFELFKENTPIELVKIDENTLKMKYNG